MRDQLLLPLEPDVQPLPNLPDSLRPMLPRPLAGALRFARPRVRARLGRATRVRVRRPGRAAGAGEVRIVDADSRDVAPTLPELAGMAVRLDARSAVLDGELVAVDDAGRADPAELGRRLSGAAGRPVAYLAFDLLHLDGRSLLNTPLHKRRQLLRRVLHPGDEIVAVPAIAAEGRALHEAAAAQGIAGVLARQRTSPYLPGTTSRLWRFIAVSPTPERPTPDLGLMVPEAPTAAAPVIALIRRLPLLFDD